MDKRSDDLIHEVEEQLKWERIEAISKEYGTYIVGFIVAIILLVGGYEYWGHSTVKHQEALSEVYTDALQLMGKGQTTEALEKLKTIKDDSTGYSMLARFVSASVLLDNPETRPQAIELYRDMVKTGSLDRRYRTLAIIYLVQAELDTADPAELGKLLEEASIGTNMWPDTTAELSALVALRKGDIEGAKKTLGELKEDKQASQGIRLRARALLEQLQQQPAK